MEGFYITIPPGLPGTRCQRNHNPGNIRYSQFAINHGATDYDDDDFAIFQNDDDGWTALIALLVSHPYCDHTLEECINRYAPPVENNTSEYLQYVCVWTHSKPTDIVLDVMERKLVDQTT